MPIPVSIIICTRNRDEHLHDTLQSIDRLSVPESLAPTLVVVDNGSTDTTQEVLHDPPVTGMPVRSTVEPQTGASRARNTALQVANGQILLWLDDDVRAPRDWLYCMTRPILEDKADAVGGKVVIPPRLRRSWMEPFHRATLAATENLSSGEPRSIISANMAFSQSVLDTVPGFDPELGPGESGTMEDVLFSWQLQTGGHETKMVTEAAVEHHFERRRLTRKAFVQAAIDRGRSLAYIRYHWLHETVADRTHRHSAHQIWRHPYFVLAKRFFDRTVQWCGHRLRCSQAPISKKEFWTIMNSRSLRQHLREKMRPRNYSKKGLDKVHGEPLT
ncbi:glycosyltransferase family 2 protein [Salinibacter ruber]|uniref:glycosyltransferase family 2 protein n=1 Tax=Salinibacter ruber TaxID=146919 RepID=UPI000E57407C